LLAFGQVVDLIGKGIHIAQWAEIVLLNMIDEFLHTSRQARSVKMSLYHQGGQGGMGVTVDRRIFLLRTGREEISSLKDKGARGGG